MKEADTTLEAAAASAPGEATLEETRIGFFAHDVSRMRRTLFDQRMKPLGITRSQWWALAQLSLGQEESDGEGLLQTELARRLDVGKVTVGGLIDRLESAGFVQRKPDRSDRRAKRIVITQSGREVLAEMRTIARGLNAEVLGGVAPDETRAALAVLDRMKRNLRRMLDEDR
ncbi:MAG: MarR family transcriptional regulator [Pseudomonadota bacterium]|nr:MarR family transcriptional regulator [Pseudomonadota bacterium]MEE3101421.1 MarR family transcriptional regulator [Pseudomonadota bacterium]